MRIVSREQTKRIEAEAERVKTECAYMDQLPFEGWMWEMVRRSRTYRMRRRRCIADCENFEGKGKFNFMRSWVGRFKAIGLNTVFPETVLSEDEYAKIDFRDGWCLGLPVRDRNYTQFKRKPSIFGSRSVHAMGYSEIAFGIAKGGRGSNSLKQFLHELSPVSAENTLFLGVSVNAQRDDIVTEILEILDICLKTKPTRRRPDMWKCYLIVYDLVKDGGYGYTDIAEILLQAYPSQKRWHDPVNVEKYYKSARDLLYYGEYTDHLSL